MNKPKCEIEEVNLKIEELEAIRLKDIEGLNQEECTARKMLDAESGMKYVKSGAGEENNRV